MHDAFVYRLRKVSGDQRNRQQWEKALNGELTEEAHSENDSMDSEEEMDLGAPVEVTSAGRGCWGKEHMRALDAMRRALGTRH